jgi:hypothetical protein
VACSQWPRQVFHGCPTAFIDIHIVREVTGSISPSKPQNDFNSRLVDMAHQPDFWPLSSKFTWSIHKASIHI